MAKGRSWFRSAVGLVADTAYLRRRRWGEDRVYVGDDAADARADASIGSQMLWGHGPDRPPTDDVERDPIPGERPHRRAQWDEVRSTWIEWDEVDREWDPVEGSGATSGVHDGTSDDDGRREADPNRSEG